MRKLLFPIAVAATSLALVVVFVATGLLPVRSALASAPTLGVPWHGGPWHGGPWARHFDVELPPELQALHDLPADQRFNHFVGVQLHLTDANSQPVTIDVTPGTVTEASANGLTIAANDGTTRAFTLDEQTAIWGKPTDAANEAEQPTLSKDDRVIVVTMNDSSVATVVVNGGAEGFGGSGSGGPWCPFGLFR